MLGAGASGVATYARALHAAQNALDPGSYVLTDGAVLGCGEPATSARLVRWGAALSGRPRSAWTTADHPRSFVGRDLFRLAQVHFDLRRRLLPIRVPGPPGIMHWSYPVPLRLVGWSNVYTVHDAIPLTRPDLTPINPRRHARLLREIACRARAIVTVSAAARHEIATALDLSPAFIADCSQAVDVTAADGLLPAGLQAGSYVLACGSVEPRKNITTLVAAHRASGIALPLVIAGPAGWRGGALEALIAATPNVVRLPELDVPTLLALIAGARLLAMPSLAEGFGLPVAEAMALGTPVVTSHRGALAEIAGGAALLVDPNDERALAAGLARLAGDAALRADLAVAGRRNVRRFSPDRFAARLADLYASLVAEPSARLYPRSQAASRRAD